MRLKIPDGTSFPRINTLRFKISVLYVAVIGFILFLFQGALFLSYANSVSKEFDIQLQMKADQIGGAVNAFRGMLGDQRQAFILASQEALNLGIEYPAYAFMPESPEKFWLSEAKKLGLSNDYLAIMDDQGNVIARSKNLTGPLLSFFKRVGRPNVNGRIFYKVNIHKDIFHIVIVPYYYAYKQGYAIAVGSSYVPVELILQRHLLFLLTCILAFLAIASLTARLFVIRILSSIMEISKVARNISQENLKERIKLIHADEEIKHLTGSLNGMIARLERSFAHIKEFSLEMAHEVKTPLSIISGESQLALEHEHTTEEYRESFRNVLKEAQRTQRFVSDLLLLTKLDYRLIKLRFESIDLGEFLREVGEKMGMISVAKGVKIQVDISPEPLFLRGDKIHLRRVFFNLIDNALKFSSQGGSICISAKRSDQKAVVSVSDTGCGITDDEISKIFNKFYRVVENGPQADPGCGLGLSIAYSIVKLHGGSIAVSSEMGKGTNFIIELPAI